MSKLSIIIPVYYSADTLMDCYIDLRDKVLGKLPDYELIMVDDGSGDNSYAIMRDIAGQDSKVRLLKLSKNFGSHAATYAGLSSCTGDCAIIKAADLQEPSELILDMFWSWRQGNKVVLAAREGRPDGSVFTSLYYWLVRKVVSDDMPEGGFDVFLIDRNVIESLRLLNEKNSAITLQILWSGFQTAVVPYTRLARQKGVSRWTLAKKIKLVVDSFVGFSFAPVRAVTVLGTLFFVGACLWGATLVVSRLLNRIPVPGYTTLMIVILMSSGLILLSLGILGEYIWRILDAARGRPVYLIDEQEKKDDEATSD
jgi:dolichol-phosphate mannosyltransferase